MISTSITGAIFIKINYLFQPVDQLPYPINEQKKFVNNFLNCKNIYFH